MREMVSYTSSARLLIQVRAGRNMTRPLQTPKRHLEETHNSSLDSVTNPAEGLLAWNGGDFSLIVVGKAPLNLGGP